MKNRRVRWLILAVVLIALLQTWFLLDSRGESVTENSEGSEVDAQQEVLPLGLRYFMTRKAVESHLVALNTYRIPSKSASEIVYRTTDAASGTTNVMFLQFTSKGLVEVDSWKQGLSEAQFSSYWSATLSVADEWKLSGAIPVLEDAENRYYLYRDNRSHFSISASRETDREMSTYRVAVTITESQYFKDGLKQ